jgi:hypothetical protein
MKQLKEVEEEETTLLAKQAKLLEDSAKTQIDGSAIEFDGGRDAPESSWHQLGKGAFGKVYRSSIGGCVGRWCVCISTLSLVFAFCCLAHSKSDE